MKKFSLTIIALIAFLFANAQENEPKLTQSYNYQRAYELMQNDSPSEAKEYLDKEISNNPKNGYAYLMLSVINAHEEEYGKALSQMEKAMKFIPKKDEKYRAIAYNAKAKILLNMKDTVQALTELDGAIKQFPKNIDLIENRGQIYFEQQKYDLSNADYQRIISIDSNSYMGYMGYGRNLVKQKAYTKASEQFSKAIQLYPDYSSGYSFRGEAYMKEKKYAEAADDFVKTLTLDATDAKAVACLQEMADSAETEIVSKLKVQAIKEKTSINWPYYLGQVHAMKGDYPKAIEFYKKGLEIEAYSIFEEEISECYSEMGQFTASMEHIENAINLDPDDDNLKFKKSFLYYNQKNYPEAIALMDTLIENNPEYDNGYYMKALYKLAANDMKSAVEDLNLALAFDPTDLRYYSLRQEINKKLGNNQAVITDCNKIIELDTIPNENTSAMYAYASLGNKQKAKEILQGIISNSEPYSLASNYYDGACVLGRMEEYPEALNYLRKALEKGYKSFTHIDRDFDMDAFRDMPEYQKIMDEFRPKWAEEASAETTSEDNGNLISAEVPFTKEGGVCKVKCSINGLPLHFIFDTGASIVSISDVEATFMFKNEYITRQDIITKSNFADANGDISEGTVINLKKVDFGGLELKNIRASVVHNQKAPLLLGQTVLGRLGRIEIDNEKKVLRISKKEGK